MADKLKREKVLLTAAEFWDAVDSTHLYGFGPGSADRAAFAEARKLMALLQEPCGGHDASLGWRFGVGGIVHRWGCEQCLSEIEAILKGKNE